jgi:hypothetical protein
MQGSVVLQPFDQHCKMAPKESLATTAIEALSLVKPASTFSLTTQGGGGEHTVISWIC